MEIFRDSMRAALIVGELQCMCEVGERGQQRQGRPVGRRSRSRK